MFWIRRQKESRRCKSMSAWFPPRLGSFTTPNIASYMEFHRSADFAASVQDLSQKLGSNAFQKQMVWVEKFESLGIFSNGHIRADAKAFLSLSLLAKHSSTRPYLPVGKNKSIKAIYQDSNSTVPSAYVRLVCGTPSTSAYSSLTTREVRGAADPEAWSRRGSGGVGGARLDDEEEPGVGHGSFHP